MKFLLDENIGKKVASFLQQLGHTALRIRNLHPGIEDYQVLHLATSYNSILVTSDKDFGELIFKEKQTHKGVVFLRLKNQRSDNKIKALRETLLRYKELENSFLTVTEKDGEFKFRKRQFNPV